MKFKDLKKDKMYAIVDINNQLLSGHYSIKDNLLYLNDIKKFSHYRVEEIPDLNFTEVPKINKATQLLLQLVSSKYKWIAKDDDGDINFFKRMPVKDIGDDYWEDSIGSAFNFIRSGYLNENINFDFLQTEIAYKIQKLIIMT